MKHAMTLLTLCLAAALCSSAGAGEEEFYVNTLRTLGSVEYKSLRGMAMGGTGRGLADGVASMGTNPAALGAMAGAEFDVAVGYDWLDDGSNDANQTTFRLGGAVNLERIYSGASGPNQAVGAQFFTQRYSKGADRNMKREQTAIQLAYGLHATDDIVAGVSLGIFDGKWKADQKADHLAMDRKFSGGDFKVGGIYRWSDDTTIGGTVRYTTGSLKEKAAWHNDGSGTLSRFGIGLGVAHQYTDTTLLMGDIWYERTTADLPSTLKETDKSWGLAVGIEQEVLPEIMVLRGGLYYDKSNYTSSGKARTCKNFSKGRAGLTAGVGFTLYDFKLGYSVDVNNRGDVKNLVDISTEW